MFIPSWPLAQLTVLDAGDTAGASLSGGQLVSQAISESFDQMWTDVLTGPLYGIINNLGLFFALLTLGFWCIQLYRKLDQPDARGGVADLIFPIIVIVFMANGGRNLANVTLSMRGIINGVNTQVVETVGANLDFQSSLDNLSGYSSARGQVSQLANQCNGITKQEELQLCLQDATAKANGLIQSYRASNPAETWVNDIQALADQISLGGGLGGGLGGAVSGGLDGGVEGAFNGAISGFAAPLLMVAEAVIIAFQGAFQYAIEVALIVTGLMGPIALGLSFLPWGAKPIYAWLTGFWSLGLCKLSLNLITGLVATAVQTAGPTNADTLVNAIAIGILSPMLALGLAAGGGKAIFDGFLAAGKTVVGAATVGVLRL